MYEGIGYISLTRYQRHFLNFGNGHLLQKFPRKRTKTILRFKTIMCFFLISWGFYVVSVRCYIAEILLMF